MNNSIKYFLSGRGFVVKPKFDRFQDISDISSSFISFERDFFNFFIFNCVKNFFYSKLKIHGDSSFYCKYFCFIFKKSYPDYYG